MAGMDILSKFQWQGMIRDRDEIGEIQALTSGRGSRFRRNRYHSIQKTGKTTLIQSTIF
jgi:hypothetical protein